MFLLMIIVMLLHMIIVVYVYRKMNLNWYRKRKFINDGRKKGQLLMSNGNKLWFKAHPKKRKQWQ